MTSLAAAFRSLARVAAVVGGVLLLVAALLAALGYSPSAAAAALWSGSFGSPAAVATTLARTVPLLLSGLAVAVAFRCGALNIGAEGQIYLGALAALLAGQALALFPPALLLPAVMLAGAAAGALWAGLAGLLRVLRHVPEVLSTIMLNFIAIHLVSYAVHGPLRERAGAYPQSDPLPAGALLPALFDGTRLTWALPIALAVLAVVGLVMQRSTWGFRLRVVGAAPQAARYLGIAPAPHLLSAMLLSGALAGLAGALELSGVTRRLYENFSPGYGYTAIAVALLARLHPAALLPAALFFGALASGSRALQTTAAIPSVLVEVLLGLVILLAVGAGLYRSRPAAPRPE